MNTAVSWMTHVSMIFIIVIPLKRGSQLLDLVAEVSRCLNLNSINASCFVQIAIANITPLNYQPDRQESNLHVMLSLPLAFFRLEGGRHTVGLENLAPPARLELATPGSEDQCSNPLS